MDLPVAVDLLRALNESIESEDLRRAHTSAAVARRGNEIAEMEALRRLQMSGSFETALAIGRRAYLRELNRIRPLSFTHEVSG